MIRNLSISWGCSGEEQKEKNLVLNDAGMTLGYQHHMKHAKLIRWDTSCRYTDVVKRIKLQKKQFWSLVPVICDFKLEYVLKKTCEHDYRNEKPFVYGKSGTFQLSKRKNEDMRTEK